MTNLTEAWINIYKHKNSYWCGTPNHTKSEALLHLADTENYLTTVNIEQLLKLQEENTKLKEQLDDYKRLADMRGEIIARMEDSDNDREKFQNKKIAKLKELVKELRKVLQKETPALRVENAKLKTQVFLLKGLLDDCRIELDCWGDKDCQRLITKINQVLGEE